MVDVQDSDAHPHKRTAIPQLLNPVSSSPTKRQEEHQYTTYRDTLQHSNPNPAARSDLTRSDSSPTGRPPFHLRAAQWEQTDSSPSNTVHYASSPETNGSVRERSVSYSTHDSGPRSNDSSGYTMVTSLHRPSGYPQSVSNPPSPAPYPPDFFLYPDGRAGKHSDDFELNCYSLIVQGAYLKLDPNHRALSPVLQPPATFLVKNRR
jgi:hypothetical protein